MVMSKDRSKAPFSTGDTVQIVAPQSRSQRATGAALRYFIRHNGISVLMFDPMINAMGL